MCELIFETQINSGATSTYTGLVYVSADKEEKVAQNANLVFVYERIWKGLFQIYNSTVGMYISHNVTREIQNNCCTKLALYFLALAKSSKKISPKK